MQVLLAVIDDLLLFARTTLFGVLPTKRKTENLHFKTYSRPLELQGPFTPPLLEIPAGVPELGTQLSAGRQYYIGQKDTCIHTDPIVSFDTVYTTLPYGSSVELLKFGGRWAQVRIGATVGWVFKDALYDKAVDVFPKFNVGAVYEAESPEAIKLRLCIEDAFNGGRAGLDLTGAEYLVYIMKRRKRSIQWPDVRPRIPGTWQRILRGRMGVHMGINPKTESIMEYVVDDIGYIAFVEAVFPDESIKVSGVGLITDGQYSELTMTKEDWRELRPTFIEVT